jgi:hypothetical protein
MTPDELDAIKGRALVRARWVTGRIGDPVPWCRYCGVKLPGDTAHEWESIGHPEGCPAPDAVRRLEPDLAELLAEVDRQRQKPS